MLHNAEVLSNLHQIRSVDLKKWAKLGEEKLSCPKCQSPIAWYDPACLKCGEKRSERLFPLKKA
jgi:predicted amidophosphoribosyltransferase